MWWVVVVADSSYFGVYAMWKRMMECRLKQELNNSDVREVEVVVVVGK